MKRKLAVIISAGILIVLMNSCIPSLHPIYTADKLVTLKQLPGTWETQKEGENQGKLQITTPNGPSGKPETWTFMAGEGKSYLLIHEDEDGFKGAFDVHIIKLGETYFMDFYPADMPDEKSGSLSGIFKETEQINNFTKIHLLAVHTFAKLEITGKDLKISMFDPDFLKQLLERQQIRIKHEKTEGGYVLTASPEDLQKFASKYANEKEAFLDDPMVLKNKL
ncbi:MAG: hypothetical protein HY842_20200 [Bacteroidetes bacterium]|nr:hypothetical protein [Bacteroidota bacterium]